MKKIKQTLVLILGIFSVISCSKNNYELKTNQNKIQGLYKLVNIEANGRNFIDDCTKQSSILIGADDKWKTSIYYLENTNCINTVEEGTLIKKSTYVYQMKDGTRLELKDGTLYVASSKENIVLEFKRKL